MRHSEFVRRALTTETIRKMDREELEEELTTLGLTPDETDPDDRLRDDLVTALTELGE